LLHQSFCRFLENVDKLNPAHIETAQTKIRDVRRRTEAISEIEARANEEAQCPACGDEQRQKWGRTRTKVQGYRCGGCQKTYTGRTGSAIGRIHRLDLFMVALRDMLGTSTPQSVRELARHLGLDKFTVWRWRMLIFSIIRYASTATFSGIVEADETYQWESRKGLREWVRHFAERANVAKPPRPRWEDYTAQGVKMMRGLSKWQLPILTVADRSGARQFQRLPNRQDKTLEQAILPLVPVDAVLCSDGARGYAKLATQAGIEHFVVGSKPGTRLMAGCYDIQNVNSLHASYANFIRPFCAPATKNLNGYIRWFEVRMAKTTTAELIRAS
jgi:transposase-like protein